MPLNNESRSDGNQGRIDHRDPHAVLELFGRIADRGEAILAANEDWGMSGIRVSQYGIDVSIDEMVLAELSAAGLGVLSEESGLTTPHGEPVATSAVVVVDPLDGSTNASLGLPWCAMSLCLVVDLVPEVALVRNLRTGTSYDAVRDRGARRDGAVVGVGPDRRLADAIIAVNARPPDEFRPRQYRAMGATALDIASVACGGSGGGFDGYVDFDDDMIGVWDYLAAILIVQEAGGVVADALGRDLVTLDHAARRRPVAASSPELLADLLAPTRRH